jgi:RNA polymerase sigma-70 factor (ECF subfamily)
MLEADFTIKKIAVTPMEKLDDNEVFFKTITELYYSDILKICFSRLCKREEAEDAVQEIFLRVYRSLNSYNRDKSFWNWLYTITINYLKTHYHGLQRLEELKERARQNVRSSKLDPAVFLERREMNNKIKQAIDSLPKQFKKVIILFYIENMRVSEISESLGISRENVKIQLYRARNMLKEILEEYFESAA